MALNYATFGQQCSYNSCLNGGTCTNITNDYVCNCGANYYGFNCQFSIYIIIIIANFFKLCNLFFKKLIIKDSTFLCPNGTTFQYVSTNTTFTYDCVCSSGYYGPNCGLCKYT